MIFNIHIIELAVISALLSLFLEFTFREGNIFEGWLDFLAEKNLPASVWEDEKIDREDKFDLIDWFWWKPLGGCVVCMNVWLSFAICLCFVKRIDLELGVNVILETLAGALLVVLVSNFLVRLFKEKII